VPVLPDGQRPNVSVSGRWYRRPIDAPLTRFVTFREVIRGYRVPSPASDD